MAETRPLPAATRLREEAPPPDISVVVTLLNEERTVDELYARTTAALDALGRPYEIVFVDDGGRDGGVGRAPGAHPRARPGCARGAVQAELRPASGDARGTRAGARGDRGDDGRR